MQFRFKEDWFENRDLHLGENGIVGFDQGRLGIGAFVMVECEASKRFLLGRKAYRPGLDISDQFTFPGGMVRTQSLDVGTFGRWLTQSIATRHKAEVGIGIEQFVSVAAQDHLPPYVGSYVVNGAAVTSVVLPFHAQLSNELTASASDPTVYDVGWRSVEDLWSEISPSNGLALANLVWDRLGSRERSDVQRQLESAYQRMAVAAAHAKPIPSLRTPG